MGYRLVIIGGSAGSFQVVNRILSQIPSDFKVPVVLVLHRLRHVRHGFEEALSQKSKLPVIEPEDKSSIRAGRIYLAPANYHLYIEVNGRFALSTEKPVNHSRPAIDLAFSSAAVCFREKIAGIILSGANKDGAEGLKTLKDYGGMTIVQDPAEAQIPAMPYAALQKLKNVDHIMNTNEIIDFIKSIH